MRNQKLICIACVLILCLCIFTACGAEVDADLHITITFMVDGEVYHEMEVKNDSRIKFPDKPTKEGYVFDGWYLTEDYNGVFSTIYLTQNEVTTDLVVYAKWAIETPSGGQHGSTDVDDDAKITGILGGDVEGLIVNLDVSSAIIDVDLSGMITVSEGSSWQLYADKTGQTNIPTKIAADLVDGENIFYIVVNSGDNKINRTYTVKIWKNFNVTVRFYVFGYEIHSVSKETHTWITDEDFPDVNYPGYRLVGWAEHKAGEEHYIDDEMLNANERIIKFNAVLEGLKHTISFDGNGVDCDLDDVEVTYGSSFVLPTLTREGYTFDGWEYDGKKIASANGNKYQGYSYAENITVKAIWAINSYNLTVTKNGNYGSVTSSSVNQYNSSVTITATPNAGYLFVGWYGYDGIKVSDDMSYTFNMPAKNVTYIAKWMVCPVALEKNIPEAGEVGGVEKAKVIGEETIITATTNPGYTWLGWYDGDTKVSDDTTYTFNMPAENKTYTAKWAEYYVTVEKNLSDAGNCEVKGGNGSALMIPAGEVVSLTATTNPGYTWLGWYDGETLLTADLSYSFTMPAESKTYTAKWTYYTVSTETNINGAGSYTNKNDEKITVGESVSLTATTYLGHAWLGWYDGETQLTTDLSYNFIMTAEDKTFTAKWVVLDEMSNFNFNASIYGCVITGIKDKTVDNIVVPDYVTSIQEGAFNGCSSLINITIPAFESYAGGMFPFGYFFGESSYAGGTAVAQSNMIDYTSYTYYIPSSLRNVIVTRGAIPYGAFSGCTMIIGVVIPKSTKSIGQYAFNNCRNLSKIYYEGTETDWANVHINSNNTVLTSTTRYYYSDCIHDDSNLWRYDADGNISTALTVGEWVVDTEPTCTTNGSKHGVCNVCGETVALEIPALGHSVGDDGVCTVCGEEISYTITNDATYAFVETDGVLQSTNHADNSSSSYVITAYKTITITFEYNVSSESSYDKFYIYHNTTEKVVKSGTSNSYTSYSITLNAGDTLTFKYTKDYTSSSGSDCCYIKNLTITKVES